MLYAEFVLYGLHTAASRCSLSQWKFLKIIQSARPALRGVFDMILIDQMVKGLPLQMYALARERWVILRAVSILISADSSKSRVMLTRQLW